MPMPVVRLGDRLVVRSLSGGGHWYSQKHSRLGGANWYAMYRFAEELATSPPCLEDLVMFLNVKGGGPPTRGASGVAPVLTYNNDVSLRCMTPSKRANRFLDGSHTYAQWGKGREALTSKDAKDHRYVFRVCSVVHDEEDDRWSVDPAVAGDDVRVGDLLVIEVAYDEESHVLDTRYLTCKNGWIMPTSKLTGDCVFELLQPDLSILVPSDPTAYEHLPDEVGASCPLQYAVCHGVFSCRRHVVVVVCGCVRWLLPRRR